jgi:hypothetical protein
MNSEEKKQLIRDLRGCLDALDSKISYLRDLGIITKVGVLRELTESLHSRINQIERSIKPTVKELCVEAKELKPDDFFIRPDDSDMHKSLEEIYLNDYAVEQVYKTLDGYHQVLTFFQKGPTLSSLGFNFLALKVNVEMKVTGIQE